jgi:hypothetical protein
MYHLFFSHLLEDEHILDKSIVDNSLEACTYVCWKFTDLIRNDSTGGNELIGFSFNTMSMLKEILPKLINWSIHLQAIDLAESFFTVGLF